MTGRLAIVAVLLLPALFVLWVAWELLPWLLCAGALFAAYRIGYRRGRATIPPLTGRPMARPVRTRLTLSAVCAGRDCALCTDRTCQCSCGHPHRRPRRPLTVVHGKDDQPPW